MYRFPSGALAVHRLAHTLPYPLKRKLQAPFTLPWLNAAAVAPYVVTILVLNRPGPWRCYPYGTHGPTSTSVRLYFIRSSSLPEGWTALIDLILFKVDRVSLFSVMARSEKQADCIWHPLRLTTLGLPWMHMIASPTDFLYYILSRVSLLMMTVTQTRPKACRGCAGRST